MIKDRTFEKITKLSMIDFNKEEKSKFKKELSNIIDFISVLDDIDLNKTEDSKTEKVTGKERKDILKKGIKKRKCFEKGCRKAKW